MKNSKNPVFLTLGPGGLGFFQKKKPGFFRTLLRTPYLLHKLQLKFL